MGNRIVWILEDNTDGTVFGVFSTKLNALNSIEMWSEGGLNPYEIKTDIGKIRKIDGADFVRITFEDGIETTLYLYYMDINNGAGITSAHRHAANRHGRLTKGTIS